MLGLADWLAHVSGLDEREVICVGGDQIREAMEVAGALVGAHARPWPFIERPPRSRDRRVRVIDCASRDSCPRALRRWIDALEPVGGVDTLSIDDVREIDHVDGVRSLASWPALMKAVAGNSWIQTRIEATGASIDSWTAAVIARSIRFLLRAETFEHVDLNEGHVGAARVVTSVHTENANDLDLALIGLTLEVDGELVATAAGAGCVISNDVGGGEREVGVAGIDDFEPAHH